MSTINIENLPKQLTDKYQVIRNSFITKDNGEKASELKVIIGDDKQDDFFPQAKIDRWSGETNFSVRLKHTEKNAKIETDGDKIKWKGRKVEAHFYDVPKTKDLPKAFELEVLLLEKPKTNKVEFTTQSKGLNFYYQPELTQQEKDDGAFRPENVIGSYAVYHESKQGDYSKMGLKNYRAGKAFHIYRPKIIDSAGTEVWGILNIINNLLTVEIPQEFLDNAVYPIRHAAGLTFGCDPASGGGTDQNIITNDIYGSVFNSPASIDTVQSLSMYGRSNPFLNKNAKGVIVLHSDLNIVNNGISGAVAIPWAYSEATWHDLEFGTDPTLTASTNYILAIIIEITGLQLRYDGGDTDQGHIDTSNSYATPTNPTDATHNNNKYSIYCTYTAAEATETVTITAKANIKQTGVAKTVQAKTRIQQTDISKTIQAKANITTVTTNSSTIQAKARIQLLTETSISAKTRIQIAGVSSLIIAKVRIEITSETTIQTKTRIKQIGITKTILGKARIEKTKDISISAKANIKITQALTIQAKVRIQLLSETTITAKARIQIAGISSLLTAKANIKQIDITKTITAKVAIKKTIATSISAKAKIELVSETNISAKANIKKLGVSTTTSAKTRIQIIDISKTVRAKVRIQVISETNIQAKANIKITQEKSIAAKAKISVTAISKIIQAKANIKVVSETNIQSKANIKYVNSSLILAKVRIEKTEIKSITAKARIELLTEITTSAKANIIKTIFTAIQTKASVKKLNIIRTLTTKANIVIISEKSITAKASIIIIRSDSVTAKANIFISDNIKTVQVKTSIKKVFITTIQTKANIFLAFKALGILPRFLNTKVDIKRKSTDKNNTGDLNEPFVVNQQSIPATIQLLTGEELTNFQGMTYNYTHRAFLPKAVKNLTGQIIYISIREGDKLYDQKTEVSYRTRQIEDHTHAKRKRNGVTLHHYELLLEKINDNRY